MIMSVGKLITVALLSILAKEIAGDDNCSSMFGKNGFIPKFADVLKSTNLVVQYQGKNATCGETLSLRQLISPPTLYYNPPSCCKNITVLGVGPDALAISPYLTWLIYNVPPGNLRKGFTTPLLGNTDNNGYIAADYAMPLDPTGGTVKQSRIIFFVYCQCGYISDKKKYVRPLRGPFDVRKLAKDKRLGNPMAGFFHSCSDTGVDVTNLTKGLPVPNKI